MQPPIPWSNSVSVFVIERQSSILWSVLCRFHWLYRCCHSLALIAICCHSFSLVVLSLSLFVSFCLTHCHSLSFVVTRCHSLSFVVTRCHSLSLVIIRCHSLSLDVPVVCLFINDPKIQTIEWTNTYWTKNKLLNKHAIIS